MAPNLENEETSFDDVNQEYEKLVAPQADKRVYKIVYMNILTFGYWHIAAIYGLYLALTSAKWQTLVFAYFCYVAGEIGVTAGAHRLWSHRAYKAKLPLQILLMFFNSIAFQNTATEWVRDHRLHHKFSDTDADPHNATRGFFYSHVGWLLVRKHPEVKKRGKGIDMSDIYNNPVLKFQKKYAIPFIGLVCFILPTVIPIYFWEESLNNAWHITMLRYVFNLNLTFLVNSAAHIWGYKPYDKNILPAQNPTVSFLVLGEGFHNYHHAFPWDYRTAELGNNSLNFTTKFIDFFAWIGWAYDLKTVSKDIVKTRAARTGDGTDLWGLPYTEIQVSISSKLLFLRVTFLFILLFVHSSPYLEEYVTLSPLRYQVYEIGRAAKLGDIKHHVFLFQLIKLRQRYYKAFCSGNIIGDRKVLTSAHCLLSNKKRLLRNLKHVKVVAGIRTITASEKMKESSEQWRSIDKIYSQKFFRFPAYNLGILLVNQTWQFNAIVNKIPYASVNFDFDGICSATTIRTTTAWSSDKVLFFENMHLIKRRTCEIMSQRTAKQYLCTHYDKENALATIETEGGGLVCYGTGDPKEIGPDGILVGITSLTSIHLPSLHNRIGMFSKWVTDDATKLAAHLVLLVFVLCWILQ